MEATAKRRPKYLFWGAGIFALYVMIALLFMPSGATTSGAGIVASVIVLCVIVLLSYIAFALWWRARETGTKIFTTADGKKRFVIPEGLKNIFKSSESIDTPKSGKVPAGKGDADDKTMSRYIILAIISVIVAKFFGYVPAGIIALAGVHLIWLFSPQKGSLITKVVIYGMLIFFVLAWLFPDTVKVRDASIKVANKVMTNAGNKAEAFADDFGKASTAKPEAAAILPKPAEAPRTVRRAQIKTVFELTPDWDSRNRIQLPSMKVIAFYCSEEGADMTITYSGGNIDVPSGQTFRCPTDTNENLSIGTGARNAWLSFRSRKPGVTATIIWG